MSTTAPAASAGAGRRPFSRLALAAIALALLAALGAVAAGLGYRLGWWPLRAGFDLLAGSAWAGLAGAGIGVAGAVRARPGGPRRGLASALVAIGVGLVVAAVPWWQLREAHAVPAIHDISTDTVDPPAFVAILPLRAHAPNPAAYGGPAVAAKQHAAYPDIVPAHLAVPPAVAFARALAAAHALGWHVVAAVPSAGRIEATDRTFWFGFTDDIVVRVRPAAGGSRVDVRSVSRVGRSDIGTNARRVRRFLARLAG